MDELEKVITHYVRTLLDAAGIQADAESEIAEAFRQARQEAEINLDHVMNRIKAIEKFIG